MGKGLPHSHSRRPPREDHVVKQTIVVDATINASATGAAPGFGSVALQGLPEGNILFLGAVANLTFTALDANLTAIWSGDYGMGTVPISGTTMTGNEVNLIVEKVIAAATAGVSPNTKGEKVGVQIIDNTEGTEAVFLQLLTAAPTQTDDTVAVVAVQGLVTLSYVMLQDD